MTSLKFRQFQALIFAIVFCAMGSAGCGDDSTLTTTLPPDEVYCGDNELECEPEDRDDASFIPAPKVTCEVDCAFGTRCSASASGTRQCVESQCHEGTSGVEEVPEKPCPEGFQCVYRTSADRNAGNGWCEKRDGPSTPGQPAPENPENPADPSSPDQHACRTNPDCGWGNQCVITENGPECLDSECHHGHPTDHAITARPCADGYVCEYRNSVNYNNGVGWCREQPAADPASSIVCSANSDCPFGYRCENQGMFGGSRCTAAQCHDGHSDSEPPVEVKHCPAGSKCVFATADDAQRGLGSCQAD